MGMDLQLLPTFRADYSHDVLRMSRDEKLFDLIVELQNKRGRRISKEGINSHLGQNSDGEYQYGQTLDDRHGDALFFVMANDLKELLNNYSHDWCQNKAITAFINELDNQCAIYLYWC